MLRKPSPEGKRSIVIAVAGVALFLGMMFGGSPGAAVPDEPIPDALAAFSFENGECPYEEAIPIIELPRPTAQETALILEECPGIRPGARLSNWCTMNFVFTDGTDIYIGTAGHCTSFVGQRMGAWQGPSPFGTVVYRHYGGVGYDFALIRIDEAFHDQVDPNICTWHGPVDSEPTTHEHQPVHHYGWGLATAGNSYERARTGTLIYATDTTIHFESFASGGDSGSPANNVLGSGLGVITHVIGSAAGSPLVLGTHVEQALAMARGGGFDVELVPGQYVEGVA